MTNITKVYVGVDVSKNHLDIYMHPSGKRSKIANTISDISKFVAVLAQYDVAQIACEATGGYEKLLKSILNEHSYTLWVVDPRRIKGFIVAAGSKSKSDRLDAQKIAEFAVQTPREYIPITKSKSQEDLQYLINRRRDLSKIMASERIRLKHPAHAHEATCNSVTRVMGFLKAEIKSFDREMDAIVEADAELKRKIEILESIPGIGRLTAATLLSFVPELGTLSNDQISALIGTCSYVNSSGNFEGKRFIKGGRFVPRSILYMAAVSTIGRPPFKVFYERLIANKKPSKVALVAVMRKLGVLANTLLKKGEMCKV